ncbi:Rossmann-fold NAD(P)-binding domain-containing protein [Sphingobacterium siyangense]|uniref:hypothetical protein n=1 Tax=Sphingobacterium siyangense TaxID=459529 RepID=UPI001965D330|nr:hypothetical protein [Sphingobacterium siyangense]QRY55506.1 hypothetical protein JVX97_15810 [Sphingobacterium siyangense]
MFAYPNGLYAETIPYFIGGQFLETGIYFPAGEGKASFAKRAEMGEAIANVIASEGHENKIYLTTGLPSYSFSDIAQVLTELSVSQSLIIAQKPIHIKHDLKNMA